MANIIRYVNTNSTAGGDGTTNATSGVNRAYAGLGEWEAAEQTDLVAAGDTAEVICSGGADTSSITLSGWTTGVSNDILIHATTDKHNGVFDSGKYFFEGDSIATRFIISQGYVRIEDLQFTRPTPASSSAARQVIKWTSSVGTQHVRRNIFKFDSNVIAGVISAFAFDSSTPDYVITDNIFDNRLASGGTNNICMTGVGGSADVLIYNNTFINWPLAINSKTNYIVKNNIFQDCAADITGTLNASNDYNLTDNGSIAGANSVASSTLTFENKAAFNFALVAGDTSAIGAGIGPSADANVPLSDIIGTARAGATTDIGAFVFVGGGGGLTLVVPSITSGESFGLPDVILNTAYLLPSAITTAESFGVPTVASLDQFIQAISVSSLEAFGEPLILTGGVTLAPTSITSQESLGTPFLVYSQLVLVDSITSEESFGIAIISDGVALVIPVGDRDTYQKIAEYLRATDKFVSYQNNEILLEWLRSEGIDEGSFNDSFKEYWGRKGYVGAYNDRWREWRDS